MSTTATKPRLTPGTPIRHRRHTYLTGTIKAIEYTCPGEVSPIPYLIAWDDSSYACDVLGRMFVYATDNSVEARP